MSKVCDRSILCRPVTASGWLLGAVIGSTAGLAAASQVGPQPAVVVEASEVDVEPEPEAPASRSLRIVRIRVKGNERVPESEILAALAREELTEGAAMLWPEDPRVRRARERLLASGNFTTVLLRLEPIPGTEDRAVLAVELAEVSSLTVTDLYLGTSKMTPFHGGLQVRERNFVGKSIHIGGGFIWGTQPRTLAPGRRQQAGRLFIEAPQIPDTAFGLGGTIYVLSASEAYRVAGERSDPAPELFRTFDYSRIGGILGLTFPVRSDLELSGDYRFERVHSALPEVANYVDPDGDATPVDLHLRDGVHRLTSVSFGLEWDGRQQAAAAGKGGRFVLNVQFSSPLVGSQYEYIKLIAGGAYTFRLPWRHWITPSVLAGQIAGDAPRFERFYAGDLSDWTPGREMGLLYSTRNPVDVFRTGINTRTFGTTFARFDLEYVWPLFAGTRIPGINSGHLYLSSGIYTIYGGAGERAMWRALGQSPAPLGFNANFGLRLETVVGTLDFSVGNILRRTPL